MLISRTSLVLILALMAVSSQAQTNSEQLAKALGFSSQGHIPTYVGAGIAGVYNSHTTDFPVYRTASPLSGTGTVDLLCANFTKGNSIMPDAWLLYERPLGATVQSLWMAPRLHVMGMGGTLKTAGLDNVRGRDPVDSSLVTMSTEHQLDASLLGLGADLFVKYPLMENVYLFGGPTLAWLLRSDATETERITTPTNAVFASDGTSERTLATGEIPNARKFQAAITLGGNVDIALSKRVFLTPEVSIALPLTDIRTDVSWRVTRIAVGASIKFDIAPDETLVPIVVQREPEKPKPVGKIEAKLELNGVIDSAGKEIEVPDLQLRVEETESLELFPLLNSVFFARGESSIPNRYHLLTPAAADTFQTSQLTGLSEMERYHDVLNVLGLRLRQSASKATIAGSAAGGDAGAAPKGLGLARANAVKNYLVSTWKIDPSRLTTTERDVPTNPSIPATPESQEENDRVTITSDDLALLAPVRISTVERSLNIPKLRIRTTYTSRYPLTTYSLSLTQGDKLLAQFNSVHPVQDWTPAASQLPSTNEPLAITLNLKDSVGTTLIARDSARVEQLTIQKKREERVRDTIREQYNLVTFDFDKSDLDARSRSIVSDVAQHVTPGDRIQVRGYTDLLGDAAHNLQLSESRAGAVRDALIAAIGTERAQSVSIDASGLGRANLVDNRYPEGRFLSRTVQILIERPIQ